MAITFAIRWTWVLGIALFLPVALPAGGGEHLETKKICRFQGSLPFLADNCCDLLATPLALAPSLRTLEIGTPLRVLRSWQAPDGDEWLQVQITSNTFIDFSSPVRRGWINV